VIGLNRVIVLANT